MSKAHEILAKIQTGLAVEKGQNNSFGGFNYRNAEDILKAVKPLLDGLTLIVDTNIQAVGERVYVEAVASLSDGDSTVSAKGYAREPLHRKGMDESQITGAATSYAKKYALGNLLAIDNEADADSMDNTQEGVPLPWVGKDDAAGWSKAVSWVKINGNLDGVLAVRQISIEDRAEILAQATAERYAEEQQASHNTENI